MQIRYIKDQLGGSIRDAGCYWVQIAAWDVDRSNNTLTNPLSNRCYNKSVTSTDSGGSGRTVAQIVDGDTSTARYYGGAANGYVSLLKPNVTIDLGALYDIEFIQVWHYYGDGRIFFNHKVDFSVNGTTWYSLQHVTRCKYTTIYFRLYIA